MHAGDEFSGTTWDVLFQGAQTAPVLEAAGTDVMGLGNHEFDFGMKSCQSVAHHRTRFSQRSSGLQHVYYRICYQSGLSLLGALHVPARKHRVSSFWTETFGMHTGVASLAAFIGNVTFPVLGACNMDIGLEPSLDVKKWHVATLNETKVALLGVIVENTANISSAGAVTFSDPVRT